MKNLSTYLLIVFLLCWTQCSMSQCGAYMEDDELGMTRGPGGAALLMAHQLPGHACCVCDLMTDGMPLPARLHLAPPVFACVGNSAPPLPAMPLADPVAAWARCRAGWQPPPAAKLCELLSRTACPVRGPTMAVA